MTGGPIKTGSFLRIYSRESICASRNVGKGGLSLKGGSLHDGFGGFDGSGGSGEHLALVLLVLQNTGRTGNRDGSAIMAVSVVTATPLKLNPPFPTS